MQYIKPTSFKEAIAAAQSETGVVRLLAGGTDVLVQLRAGMVTPDTLIDLKGIDGTDRIEKTADGGWTIGIAVPGAVLSHHAEFVADWPGVAEAVDMIGSTQVQGRATLAGNLCNASPAADAVPAMIAAGASVTLEGPDGTRELPVADIPQGPGKTALKPAEIVTAITLPPRGADGGDAYLRFIPRTEMDIAVVGAGVSLSLNGDEIIAARVALGAVAPTARLVPEAAAALIGSTLDEAALEKLDAAASAACDPITDKRGTIEFRTKVAGVLAKRTAALAYKRAKGEA